MIETDSMTDISVEANRNHLEINKGPVTENSDQINLQFWVKTDTGRVRQNNEDNFMADEVRGLFMVADGMGGHEHGDLASQRAVESVCNSVHNAMGQLKASREQLTAEGRKFVEKVVQKALITSNKDVYSLAKRKGVVENMGTTLSMLLFMSPQDAIIGHVGDSRIYRIRNKEVTQLTEDQTHLQDQLRKGLITPEEAHKLPYGNALLQAVGYQDKLKPDIFWAELEPGDQFLICSDGLHQYLIEDEIVTVFSQERGSNIVPRLIKCANARGGKDNITAVVIEMEDPNAHLPSTQLDVNTELLAQCPLLNELGFTQAMQLIPLGQIRTFLKDEVLQAEEEPHIGLVLVLSGRISFFRRGVFFDSIGSGSHFGESSLFGQLYASESAICEEETRVMVFPVSALRRYLHENTEFSNNLMWQIAKHQARKVRNYIGRLSQLLP